MGEMQGEVRGQAFNADRVADNVGMEQQRKNRIGDGRDNYEYRISCARARKSSGLDGGRVVMHGARVGHTDI